MKWSIQYLKLLAGIIIFSMASISPAYAKCEPLLVFYGGAADERSGIMKGFVQELKDSGAYENLLYFHHDEQNPSQAAIQGHLKLYPRSPLILIGHSWGGNTAYGVAKDWDSEIDLLVTLDAVGGRAYPKWNFEEFKEDLKKPDNVAKWINVWIDPPGFLTCVFGLGYFWQRNNCIADTGATWGYQQWAKNIEFEGDHVDIGKMFIRVSGDIKSALVCS